MSQFGLAVVAKLISDPWMLPFVIPLIYPFGIQAVGEYIHDKNVWYKILLSENKLSFVRGKSVGFM